MMADSIMVGRSVDSIQKKQRLRRAFEGYSRRGILERNSTIGWVGAICVSNNARKDRANETSTQ